MPPRPFSRVLVANRGEIAVRIIRACRDAGLSPVAVYSETDRHALHVRLADAAVAIGPAAPAASYLHIEHLLEAARRTGCQAVHPGYGFLAENADFAQACQDAGLIFIGPRAAAIRRMGSKLESRRIAAVAGVPTITGSRQGVRDAAELQRVAEEIGLPILVKASAGGGGKGMRIVRTPSELASAFAEAGGEAASAFGDPTLYVEKYLERPRHVEIQILADSQGHCIHLGERECSIQRRHQKLVEESPSPVVTPELRRRLGEAAVAIAREVGYSNAGTVEFLVCRDARGELQYYFLEMNTRLQVEHAVSELVTGLDLVQEQFRIAAGEPLGLSQPEVSHRGCAIECRICAEDPDQDFQPCPGRLSLLRLPAGPGVRVDSGVDEGDAVPLEYDPLIAKLITWGTSREQARRRMLRALAEFRVAGVRTTIPFFERLLVSDAFRRGDLHTSLVSELSLHGPAMPSPDDRLAAAAAAVTAFLESRSTAAASPRRWTGGWRTFPRGSWR